MKNVAVCSASHILPGGLQAILAPSFHVLDPSPSIEALEEQLLVASPDLIILEMSPMVSVDALCRIGTMAPKSRIILWIDTVSPELVSQCLAAGVRGVLSKAASAETHVRCLTEVAEGALWIDQALGRSLLSARRIRLSPRERQMISLLVQGLSNKELAWAMGITAGTVKIYLSRMYAKVGVADRFELALLALKNVPIPSEIASGIRRRGECAKAFVFPEIIWMSSGSNRNKLPDAEAAEKVRSELFIVSAGRSRRVSRTGPDLTWRPETLQSELIQASAVPDESSDDAIEHNHPLQPVALKSIQ